MAAQPSVGVATWRGRASVDTSPIRMKPAAQRATMLAASAAACDAAVTPAAELPGQLSEPVKEQRNQILLETVNRIAIAKHLALVGTRQQVLCEGPSKSNSARLSGRTPQNKSVVFEGDAARLTGQLLDLHIDRSTGFTLYGSVC